MKHSQIQLIVQDIYKPATFPDLLKYVQIITSREYSGMITVNEALHGSP
jgi:hypothetical protein